MKKTLALALCALPFLTLVGHAQDTLNYTALARRAATRDTGATILRILRSGTDARAKLGAQRMSEALGAVALGSESSPEQRSAALAALHMSLVSAPNRPGFEGSAPQLMLVAQRSPVAFDRRMALNYLTASPNAATALEFYRSISIADDALAEVAMQKLYLEMGQKGGREVLREIWQKRLPKHPKAVEMLDWYAAKLKWTR